MNHSATFPLWISALADVLIVSIQHRPNGIRYIIPEDSYTLPLGFSIFLALSRFSTLS